MAVEVVVAVGSGRAPFPSSQPELSKESWSFSSVPFAFVRGSFTHSMCRTTNPLLLNELLRLSTKPRGTSFALCETRTAQLQIATRRARNLAVRESARGSHLFNPWAQKKYFSK